MAECFGSSPAKKKRSHDRNVKGVGGNAIKVEGADVDEVDEVVSEAVVSKGSNDMGLSAYSPRTYFSHQRKFIFPTILKY